MVALTRYNPAAHSAFGQSRITDVFETKTFFVVRGRNAWHSTWVTHYWDGCLHNEWQSARDRAEGLREQGSVFSIHERPTLAFRSETGTFALVEINSAVPFSHWAVRNRAGHSDDKINPKRCQLERRLRENPTVGAVAEALFDKNVFPTRLPGASRNVIALAVPDHDVLTEDRRKRMKRWHSRSEGANYYLAWHDVFSDVSGKAVRLMADALASRVSG